MIFLKIACPRSRWLRWHRVSLVIDYGTYAEIVTDYADRCRRSHWLCGHGVGVVIDNGDKVSAKLPGRPLWRVRGTTYPRRLLRLLLWRVISSVEWHSKENNVLLSRILTMWTRCRHSCWVRGHGQWLSKHFRKLWSLLKDCKGTIRQKKELRCVCTPNSNN